MSHFWVDDMLHSHPKARKAGLRAIGLWTVCGSFMCGPHGSKDGTIDREDVERIARDHGENDWRAMAQKLLTCGKRDQVGLWEETENGYRFHDFHHYRPGTDKDQIRKERDAARKRRARMHESASADASADIPRTPGGHMADASADGPQTDTGHDGTRPRTENPRARPRAGSSPSPSPSSSGSPQPPKGGGAAEDAIPESESPSAAWLRAIRLAGAPGYVIPKSGLAPGLVQALEQDWGTARSGCDWTAYCETLAVDVSEWVRETIAEKRTRYAVGWPWSVFAVWRAERDADRASGSARSPATAVYVPVDTSDAVPPPDGFLEALKGIGGPALNRGRA